MSDELRDRLGQVADEGTSELSDAARERVLEAVRRQGPATVRAARSQRVLATAVAGLAIAAAVALAFVATRSDRGSPLGGAIAGGDHRACEAWNPASADERDGVLDLGPRGAVTTDGTARVEAGDPCTTNVVLDEGRVDVRADDLGGGVLRVEAGPVRVEVWGTQFSVTREGPRVAVAVTEGRVVVTNSQESEVPEIHLHAGERWSRGGDVTVARTGTGTGTGAGTGAGTGTGTGTGTETG
ncbi:MAG: FecR domain-containing protein, partial [Deltaproteobacteria bacterium]|nr:FecR domain-containing protein [Deltaproteobacteria bacterium]